MMMKKMNMESVILEDFEKKYPNAELQMKQLINLIETFPTLKKLECKFVVGDILCLAKMLYEAGNERIIFTIRKQILALEEKYYKKKNPTINLKYLSQCLTNFKPAIFKTIQKHFANIYSVDPKLVKCLPKIDGQQVGTKVKIYKQLEDMNPIIYYVKTHQEFSSKSHSQFISVSSDKTGKVDFKELFMYKVLEYIGYGPKTLFIVPKDIAIENVEEGILIATQDLGHTKSPHKKTKSFKIFKDIQKTLNKTPVKDIPENTTKDIIAIDMLSRSFLLEDVMVNTGNFGRITTSQNNSNKTFDGLKDVNILTPGISNVGSKKVDNFNRILTNFCITQRKYLGSPVHVPIITRKWKILDFMSPKRVKNRGDDYSYEKHYPGGKDIFYSFKVGNISHTYDSEELDIINKLLSEKNAGRLWLQVANNLIQGASRNKKYMPIKKALDLAFKDITSFMEKHSKTLNTKEERSKRRMKDLALYKKMILQNFDQLCKGIIMYCKKMFDGQKNIKNPTNKTSCLSSEKNQRKSGNGDTDSDSENYDQIPDLI